MRDWERDGTAVLTVDDDVAGIIDGWLEREGFDYQVAHSVQQALEHFAGGILAPEVVAHEPAAWLPRVRPVH